MQREIRVLKLKANFLISNRRPCAASPLIYQFQVTFRRIQHILLITIEHSKTRITSRTSTKRKQDARRVQLNIAYHFYFLLLQVVLFSRIAHRIKELRSKECYFKKYTTIFRTMLLPITNKEKSFHVKILPSV